MQSSGLAASTAATCAFISRQSPRYTYGGQTISPEQPSTVAALASATDSAVLRDEIDATSVPYPLTAFPSVRKMSVFSLNESVAPSPREPKATTPVHPFSSSQRQCSARNP